MKMAQLTGISQHMGGLKSNGKTEREFIREPFTAREVFETEERERLIMGGVYIILQGQDIRLSLLTKDEFISIMN